MRPGCVKVESDGSLWWIDDTLRQYLRLPKHEGPRENPQWGSTEAGLLQDAKWHDFTGEWEISDVDGRLRIWWGEFPEECVNAPNARVVGST